MSHANDNTSSDNTDNIVDLVEYDRYRLAQSVGVLRYQAPINTCAAPGCDTPTSGVFCLSCATR